VIGSATAAGPPRDRLDWRADAACRDADPDLFFPDDDIRPGRGSVKQAKSICRGCPVSAACLNWALVIGAAGGIWGGLTEPERRGLSRRGRRSRPPADFRTWEMT